MSRIAPVVSALHVDRQRERLVLPRYPVDRHKPRIDRDRVQLVCVHRRHRRRGGRFFAVLQREIREQPDPQKRDTQKQRDPHALADYDHFHSDTPPCFAQMYARRGESMTGDILHDNAVVNSCGKAAIHAPPSQFTAKPIHAASPQFMHRTVQFTAKPIHAPKAQFMRVSAIHASPDAIHARKRNSCIARCNSCVARRNSCVVRRNSRA